MFLPKKKMKWTASSEFGTYRLCEQRRFRRACASARGTFKQKARSLAPLNGCACAVKICHDGMLEDTNSLDGAQIILIPSCFDLFTIMNKMSVGFPAYVNSLKTDVVSMNNV